MAKKKTSKKTPARSKKVRTTTKAAAAKASATSVKSGKSAKKTATRSAQSVPKTAASKKTTTRTTVKASAGRSASAAKATAGQPARSTRAAAAATQVKAANGHVAKAASGARKSAGKSTSSNGSATHGVQRPAASANPTPEPTMLTGPLTDDQLRQVKTGLTRKDLDYYRQLLLEKRAEIVGSVEGMQEARNSGGGETSHMPLHMADVGSDHFEQEFNLGLMESEKRLLREIDAALGRIQNGTYGVCIESGRPIPKPRLEAQPWAKYCIEVAMERERRGLR